MSIKENIKTGLKVATGLGLAGLTLFLANEAEAKARLTIHKEGGQKPAVTRPAAKALSQAELIEKYGEFVGDCNNNYFLKKDEQKGDVYTFVSSKGKIFQYWKGADGQYRLNGNGRVSDNSDCLIALSTPKKVETNYAAGDTVVGKTGVALKEAQKEAKRVAEGIAYEQKLGDKAFKAMKGAVNAKTDEEFEKYYGDLKEVEAAYDAGRKVFTMKPFYELAEKSHRGAQYIVDVMKKKGVTGEEASVVYNGRRKTLAAQGEKYGQLGIQDPKLADFVEGIANKYGK